MADIKFVGAEEALVAKLVDHMGDDLMVVNAARVTMGVKHPEFDEIGDARLIDFLARESHVTPFRHPTISLKCKAPIAIARQLGKHQVGFQWNEKSRRYKDGDVEVFLPDKMFCRPDDLHSGSGDEVGDLEVAHAVLKDAYANAIDTYDWLLQADLAPEQARFVLPQGMVTEWIWTGSLYGWFNLFKQRSSSHAQYEAQLFAQQVEKIMESLYPVSWGALVKYQVKTK